MEKNMKEQKEEQNNLTNQRTTTLTPELVAEMLDTIRNYASIIRENIPDAEISPSSNRKLGLVRNNLKIFDATAEFVAYTPSINSPNIDVNIWNKAVDTLKLAEPIRTEINMLSTSLVHLERVLSEIIFDYFNANYKWIKLLAAEGLPDAITILRTMRAVYNHLRGKRGSYCPIKLLNKEIVNANKVIKKYQDKLIEILEEKRLLAENLTEDIHKNSMKK